MQIIDLSIPDVKLLCAEKHVDERGYFMESFPEKWGKTGNMPLFVQDNFAVSKRHVLRGMHYQKTRPQAKLVWVSFGSIIDVAVDLRKNSSTFLSYVMVQLTEDNNQQIFIPEGFAHGYLVQSEKAHVHYKVSSSYNPKDEGSFRYDDPTVHISWPEKSPILSEKDRTAPFLQIQQKEEV